MFIIINFGLEGKFCKGKLWWIVGIRKDSFLLLHSTDYQLKAILVFRLDSHHTASLLTRDDTHGSLLW